MHPRVTTNIGGHSVFPPPLLFLDAEEPQILKLFLISICCAFQIVLFGGVSCLFAFLSLYMVFHRHLGRGYTSSPPLPNLENTPVFPPQPEGRSSPSSGEAPTPYPWAPKFLPEQWVYTDGSDITGHPRLGAAVVHIPTSTTIYIDAATGRDGRNPHRHAGGIGSHTYGPFHILYPQLDRHIHRLPIQSPSH